MEHADALGDDDLVMLVKVGKSAALAAGDGELYELARKWWKANPVQAQRAQRVLAVADSQIIAAYVPTRWETSTSPDAMGRVAFHGETAPDHTTFVGRSVKHLYPQGASNPVRYTTVAATLGGASTTAPAPSPAEPKTSVDAGDLFLLLRVNQSWSDGITAEELYEATRGFWVMSPTRAEQVTKVFAVAHGIVREVYEPLGWEPSPQAGEENRIGFDGRVAPDAQQWRGLDVSALFSQGSQNPVKYVPSGDMDGITAFSATTAVKAPPALSKVRAFEPGLAEQIEPLLSAMEGDLLWSMSRAAQELFHSNTLGWLMSQHPVPCAPLRALFEGPDPLHRLQVWREWRHLDLVAQRNDDKARFVVENKLYSIPYREQLEKYAEVTLPWSQGHGRGGAPDTSYFLLTLMDPNFDLPAPWRRVSYESLLRALEMVDCDHLGADADLFDRYRTLVHRLVELKDAVDPRRDLDGPFSVAEALGGDLGFKWFTGPLQRMRFTGLAQAISDEYGQQLPLDVDISRSMGLITYTRHLTEHRSIGWQFQENQLRLFVLVRDPGLAGKGKRLAAARAEVAEAEYASWVDFTAAESVLGDLLEPKAFQPGAWQRFAPDFVYRYRKVDQIATTGQLAEALAELTAYTQSWSMER